jgi:hypothetical protein
VLDFAFNGITNWGFRFYAASKISPAESIRFAESFHRSFVTLPDDCPELNKIAYAADNPDIVLFHVLPAAAGKSVLLRTLNAAEEERETLIKCHHRPTSVRLVDLQSELLDDGESRLKMQSAGWSYRFRKREIVTFEIKF